MPPKNQANGNGNGNGNRKNEKNEKKNEFEIWSKFNDSVAALIADEAQRMKRMASAIQPAKGGYTLGEYVLDQANNMTRLIESYIDAADSAAGRPKRKRNGK